MSVRGPLFGVILFLVASIAATWTVYATLQRGVPGRADRYSAMFTDVSGLRTGDDVRMAGVRVGRVDGIDLDGTFARVTFEVQHGQPMYTDTVASVTYQNLIGQRYIGLSLRGDGTHTPLRPGAQLPPERTEASFDLSTLLNGFEPLFSVLQPKDVDNITAAVIRALQGDNGSVAALIAETSRLAETLTGPDEVLGRLIDNLARVLTDLAGQRGDLQTVITQTGKIFEGLSAQRDTLFAQVDSLSAVLDRAARVVQGAQPQMSAFLTREPGFSKHFLDNRYKFAYLGYNLPLMLQGMARIVDNGAYLNAYVCNLRFSITPGVDPVVANLLALAAPSGKVENSAICR
ncbi:MlaD family protein [Nocardia sp. alder85J]|uniref:MlaD family protein n=1 Tax=Nocardia sp. alder85J TaxID=2862949 RepID=UPI001CD6E0B0|nr:MlaD family protein [Nocardia sp. alder85J]MCX4091763.1 MlaD family protein [Nocardia sp. alder85J]